MVRQPSRVFGRVALQAKFIVGRLGEAALHDESFDGDARLLSSGSHRFDNLFLGNFFARDIGGVQAAAEEFENGALSETIHHADAVVQVIPEQARPIGQDEKILAADFEFFGP